MLKKYIHRITILLGLLLLVISIGVAGYMIIDDYNFIDALLMTIITVSTVGYTIVKPLSPEGKVFTIFLIISSISIFATTLTYITRYFFDGEFREHLKQYKVENKIKDLKNHVIVCGYGRNGRQAVRELEAHKESFVVIDLSDDKVELLKQKNNYLYIQGDATDDEVLKKLNLANAKAVITSLPSDANNLYVVVSVRALNKSVKIISRASNENSDIKLKNAGADYVIMPDKLGGKHMAELVVQPNIIEFIDNLMLAQNDTVKVRSIFLNKRKKNFSDIFFKEVIEGNTSGAIILGTKTVFGDYIYNPTEDLLLVEQEYIFALGNQSQIKKLEEIIYS